MRGLPLLQIVHLEFIAIGDDGSTGPSREMRNSSETISASQSIEDGERNGNSRQNIIRYYSFRHHL